MIRGMEPRIEPIKNGVAAVGEGWAVVAADESAARDRFAEALRAHADIEARPDPHPYPIEQRLPAWQSQTVARG